MGEFILSRPVGVATLCTWRCWKPKPLPLTLHWEGWRQFKRQTEEYRNVVKSHKQTKEGLKARLTGPGAPASGDDHSEELR